MSNQSIKTIDVFQVKFTKKNNIQVLMILKITLIKKKRIVKYSDNSNTNNEIKKYMKKMTGMRLTQVTKLRIK